MGYHVDISRIELITTPKVLGYSFNPVSFYQIYVREIIKFTIFEINNTFGERCIYLLSSKNEIKDIQRKG